MSFARDLIYSFVNKRGDEMARFGPPEPYHKMIEGGTDDDLYLHGLLNQAEDERLHDEAQKLYDMHDEILLAHGPQVAQGFAKAAILMDPYTVKDGQLVHKVTGQILAGVKPGERCRT